MKQKYFYALIFVCTFFNTIGQNNALQLNNDTSLTLKAPINTSNYHLNSSTFTIEYDFYLNSLTDFNASFISFETNPNAAKPIHFYINNLGVSNLLLGDGTTEESVPGMPTFNAQQWYHIAFVVTNTATKNIKVYVNGMSVADYNFTTTLEGFTTQSEVRLGYSGTNTVDATFDNLRIWSSARTDSEIANNYNACLVGDEIGLDVLFSFDGHNRLHIENLAINSILNKGIMTDFDNYSYVSGSGCTITPLQVPINVSSSSYNLILYYAGEFNGKPFYRSENYELDCENATTQARCAAYSLFLVKIVWQNNQWELFAESCVWELGEACVSVYDSNPSFYTNATNTADTDIPPCIGWTFNGSFTATFSSDDCDALSIEDEVLEKSIVIYPNPTKGILNIKSTETVSVEVYDMIGKLMLSKTIENEFQKLDLSNFSAGIYLLNATNKNGVNQTYKIIKE